eukprot:3796085-Amphidinium_carterae.1
MTASFSASAFLLLLPSRLLWSAARLHPSSLPLPSPQWPAALFFMLLLLSPQAPCLHASL